MPRGTFMQVQRDFARGGPARQVIGVEIEGARTFPVGGALLIGPASLELLAEFLIGADLQRGLGQDREELRDNVGYSISDSLFNLLLVSRTI